MNMTKHKEREWCPGIIWAVWFCDICGHDESTITAAPVTEHECPVCAGEKEKITLKMEGVR
jgi:rubrerythrin